MAKAASIYLDHAAATPLDARVLKAMMPYLETEFSNPSSIYGAARITRLAIEDARALIADCLGAKTTEIIMTSSGTESNNLAVQGVLRAHPGAHWVTSAIEHDAVLSCLEPMQRQGFAATTLPVNSSGYIEITALTAAVTDETVLVSLMFANNEIGTIQPIVDAAEVIAQVRADRLTRGIELPLYLHTDACQAAGYLDLHVSRLRVDLMTINGAKIYGPKGAGLLYVRHGVQLEPLLYGGGQERDRRSGTENVAGAVGLALALRLAVDERHTEAHRLVSLRDHLNTELERLIPDIILNGDLKRRLPNNLNYTIPGANGEAVVLYLDKVGIMASTGSACSSGDLDPSHVLLALGRTTTEADQSLRLSFGRSTDMAAIEGVMSELPKIIKRVRELA
jgi:cysteine desulfurase